MNDNIEQRLESSSDISMNGVYGQYYITDTDRTEVQYYRFALLSSGLAFTAGLIQWVCIGPEFAWIWLILLSISIGLALRWIHIYLRPLHQLLQLFWTIGTIGLAILLFKAGPESALSTLQKNNVWLICTGPLFASLTGLGFKEFFCFRRIEAIGLTFLIPTALLGHLLKINNNQFTYTLLILSATLLVLMAIRKFGNDAAADIGDKSIFDYLARDSNESNPNSIIS